MRKAYKGILPNEKLVAARMEHNWSQQELATQIGTTFVSVSRWERGVTLPGAYYRRLLCQIFGKGTTELGFDFFARELK